MRLALGFLLILLMGLKIEVAANQIKEQSKTGQHQGHINQIKKIKHKTR